MPTTPFALSLSKCLLRERTDADFDGLMAGGHFDKLSANGGWARYGIA